MRGNIQISSALFLAAGFLVGIIIMNVFDTSKKPVAPPSPQNNNVSAGEDSSDSRAMRGEVVSIKRSDIIIRQDDGLVFPAFTDKKSGFISAPGAEPKQYKDGDVRVGDYVTLWVTTNKASGILYAVTITKSERLE